MNALILYNANNTFTNTLYEHVSSFATYSTLDPLFAHQDQRHALTADLSRFDVVIIHYSVRLPLDDIAESTADALAGFNGLKVLFIQDEYEHTHRAWHWIHRLGIQLVFTAVPEPAIARVYPPEEFPGVRFVNTLTGYVPEDLPPLDAPPPSRRGLVVGYRGRPLPLRCGRLGQEKIEIGRLVKAYCESRGVPHDIAWAEDARIYGPQWPRFLASCRAVLGTESGANIFDVDGTLQSRIDAFRRAHPSAGDEEVLKAIVDPDEVPGLMNQVSPRIFEAIAARAALVLFEGHYSGVVVAGRHFISLEKDGGNLDDVFAQLGDGEYVDAMTERAYQDVIVSGLYSYQAFVRTVDEHVTRAVVRLGSRRAVAPAPAHEDLASTTVTVRPIRRGPPQPPPSIMKPVFAMWRMLPAGARAAMKQRLRFLDRG